MLLGKQCYAFPWRFLSIKLNEKSIKFALCFVSIFFCTRRVVFFIIENMHVGAYWFLLSNISERRASHTWRMARETLPTALSICNSWSGWQEIWNIGVNSSLSLIVSC